MTLPVAVRHRIFWTITIIVSIIIAVYDNDLFPDSWHL